MVALFPVVPGALKSAGVLGWHIRALFVCCCVSLCVPLCIAVFTSLGPEEEQTRKTDKTTKTVSVTRSNPRCWGRGYARTAQCRELCDTCASSMVIFLFCTFFRDS